MSTYISGNRICIDTSYVNALTKQQAYELWHLRLGHPGTSNMSYTRYHSTGNPTHWKKHPFHLCDPCTDAKICKTICNKTESKPRRFGAQFHLDYGFKRASDPTYDSYPKQKENKPIVASRQGHTLYLTIQNSYTRMLFVFLTTNKEPPLDILGKFLKKHKPIQGMC